MTRLSWYRHLRSGFSPMPASHAWLQALIYEGKELDDPYFSGAIGEPLQRIDRLVMLNHIRAACDFWKSQVEPRPFIDLLRAKR